MPPGPEGLSGLEKDPDRCLVRAAVLEEIGRGVQIDSRSSGEGERLRFVVAGL